MAKISIEEVEATLLKQKIEKNVVSAVLKELAEIIQEVKEDKGDALPKEKNEFLVILSDPNDELQGKELVSWVVQMRVGDDSGQVIEKIKAAARETNEAKKRKKHMITTLGEAFEGIKRKYLKPKNILIKTKSPVRVLIADNKL